MNQSALCQIEESIDQLPIGEQLWLVERITQHIREGIIGESPQEDQLFAMAADPEIQSELRAIDGEFSCAEADGLASM